jgi:hypothetical protein
LVELFASRNRCIADDILYKEIAPVYKIYNVNNSLLVRWIFDQS